ncbi:hypothetical protein O3G_MSEX012768 [Manduca sexta]|uniref:C2 domain-containing protein n=1 Tax=Manduca sexta TaxID=7130 RepID=A0A922CW28_MANSE|nr:hypothetical protein O3G_MSEX012768 [Manduca sexta]
MEQKRKKTELSASKRKHFAKLHERIHIKYEQMQRKLEKSRSVDTLPTLEDNFSYKELFVKDDENKELDEIFKQSEKVTQSLEHLVVVEDRHRHDASYQLLDLKEASISESELGVNDIHKNGNGTIFPEDHFFGDDFTRHSLESLNEVANESDEYLTPSTSPPPKISIRDRIGSRISAVKERRRRMEQERNMAKDRKKQSRDKVEKFILSNTTKQDRFKLTKKIKVATVTIALIEATNVEIDATEEKPRVLFCRFRLGSEKYKSKTIKCHSTSEIKWQELFNLNMFEDNHLELSLWDRDSCIGRAIHDLSEMEKEKTHKLRVNLEGEGPSAQLFVLLTVTGTSTNSLIDLDDYQVSQRRLSIMKQEFAWYHLKSESKDVGALFVIVYGAKGLVSNDNYCILTLNNARVQTHTDYKTNEPNWMKYFSFPVTDITSILEVTVHDEKRSEDVAKISIPLLQIKNGEKVWYALKDASQRDRAKGNNPRILLEIRVSWNFLRSAIRVINTKEENFLEIEERLHRHIFARNLGRAKVVVAWILNAFRVAKTLFEWESTKSNLIALSIWLPFCWFFKIWMLPLLLLIPFAWYRPPKYYLVNWKRYFRRGIPNEESEENSKKDKEEKTSLRDKINNLQEMIQSVQNFLGKAAALFERIKNLFNFTVPFLSFLAIFFILVIGFVMYMIPLRYICMIWGE